MVGPRPRVLLTPPLHTGFMLNTIQDHPVHPQLLVCVLMSSKCIHQLQTLSILTHEGIVFPLRIQLYAPSTKTVYTVIHNCVSDTHLFDISVRAGRFGLRTPVGARNSLFTPDQNAPGASPAYTMDTGLFTGDNVGVA
jgi:hypothetical protein